jgi:peptidoglycan-associated lipoprotein
MKNALILILLLTGALGFAACSQKKMTRAEPSQPAKVATEQKDTTIGKIQTTKIPEDKQLAASDVKTTDISAQSGKKDVFEIKDVYFDFDRYNIRPESRAALHETASWLLKNKTVNVSIEGHCDERGTNEYNLALGDRRANTVMEFLNALGVKEDRIKAVTYGEEKPLCTEQNEYCWQKNRRVHFVAAK